MNRIVLFLCIAFVGTILLACAPKAAPLIPVEEKTLEVAPVAKEGWEAEWEKILKEAQKEGKAVVYASTGAANGLREVAPILKQKYGIDLDIVIGRGAELSAKLLQERARGLFIADIMMSGLNTIYGAIKPAGALDSLEPAIILPEVKDPTKWYGGKLPWADKEKTVFKNTIYPSGPFGINTELIQPFKIKSYYDLLEPEWKGKMVVNDPTVSGSGFNAFSSLLLSKVLNTEFFRQFVNQKPVVIRDLRLQAEWLARGKYPLVVWPNTGDYVRYIEAGAPITFSTPKEGTHLASAAALTLINRAPHPNAARILINMLLTSEGQLIYQKSTGRQTARIDIPPEGVEAANIRKPGEKYFESSNDNEEWLLHEQDKYYDIAREIFKPVLGR